jgi:hypothetical protein
MPRRPRSRADRKATLAAQGPIEPQERIMNIVAKLCLASLAIAFLAVGTFASSVNVKSGDVAAATNAASGALVIALNPQPLPPGDRDDDFDFRG